MHGATQGVDLDRVLISEELAERHHEAAAETAAVALAVRRWWTEGLGYDVCVDIGDEIGIVLPDGRLRLVADVCVGHARVVVTLLGAVAAPSEWAERPVAEWPS